MSFATLGSRPGRSSVGDSFGNPYMDVASLSMPTGMRNALYFAEFIYQADGTYRSALERVISYFLTDVEFHDDEASDDEKKKWEKFLRDTLDIYSFLQQALKDRVCYGNAYMSLLVPFKRFLSCPNCRSLVLPLKEVYENKVFRFAWENMHFVATCPKCHHRGAWKVQDLDDDKEQKIKLHLWSPHQIEIVHSYYDDECAYLWRIPEEYKQQLKQGHLFHLEHAPRQVLKAVRENVTFRFHPDAIYHMKEPTLSGVLNRGWGIPRALTNYRRMFYVQVLRRQNEAIALDYVTPFRLITPAPRAGAGGVSLQAAQMQDPLMAFSMGDFKGAVSSMIRRRRRDPAMWNILPFPVQYQALGGDATKFAPVDLLNQGTEQLLNDVGVPVEMMKGTLTLTTAAPALRLFEAVHHHLVHDTNRALAWVEKQVAQVLSWQPAGARLRRVMLSDDLQKNLFALQLLMGQQLSGETAYRGLGYDWRSEQRRMGDEALYVQEIQKKMQDKADTAALGGELAKGNIGAAGGAPGQPAPAGQPAGAPAGGQAPTGAAATQGPVDAWLQQRASGAPIDPATMMTVADEIAQSLLGLPSSMSRSQLLLLSSKDEHMSALVKERQKKLRQRAQNVGGQQMLQQQFGPPQG